MKNGEFNENVNDSLYDKTIKNNIKDYLNNHSETETSIKYTTFNYSAINQYDLLLFYNAKDVFETQNIALALNRLIYYLKKIYGNYNSPTEINIYNNIDKYTYFEYNCPCHLLEELIRYGYIKPYSDNDDSYLITHKTINVLTLFKEYSDMK